MGLRDNIRTEEVRRLPLRQALLVGPETPIRTAIATMKAKQLGCVIVVDADDKPIGTFTERVVVRMLARYPEAVVADTVGEHLDTKWAVVRETDPVLKIVTAMQEQDVRFVVVTDEEGKAKALTGQKGLMEYIADHYPHQLLIQRAGRKPSSEREGA